MAVSAQLRMAKRHDAHRAECFVTTIGGDGSSPVRPHRLYDQDVDVRLGLRDLNPRVYIGVGYIWVRTTTAIRT